MSGSRNESIRRGYSAGQNIYKWPFVLFGDLFKTEYKINLRFLVDLKICLIIVFVNRLKIVSIQTQYVFSF